MGSSELKTILKEYENKRFQKELDLAKKKESFYEQIPKLRELDMSLNSLGISTLKEIVSSEKKEHSGKVLSLSKEIEVLQKERNTILASMNLTEKDFSVQYDCPLCKDTGYQTQENGTSLMCSCLTQKLFDLQYNRSNLSNIENENFSTFNFSFYSDKPDTQRYGAPISPRENIKIIKNICENFVRNFENPTEKNLLFVGNTGLGKTFLSNCIAKEILSKKKTVLYQTAPVMFDSLLDDKFGKTKNNLMENILDADLLIIDDLGTEYRNDLKFADFYEIINTRLLNPNHKTIISTNLSLTTLFETYDERIISRLVEKYNICKFFGEDIRFQKK